MTPKSNEPHWYVAYVKSCMERRVAENLQAQGYEFYLPIQKEIRQWSDRKKVVDRLVLPRMIFIRCLEHDRTKIKEAGRFIVNYMCSDGPYTAIIVPDYQMTAFISMVEKGRNVNVSEQHFAAGDKVRIVSGPLQGMECELTSINGQRCLAVRLGALGTATMDLDTGTLEKIS
ncbi:MAG: UpxY family transcription antiterminator [Bacteroidia bacterium]|nr:UpxY family transcription antiterminator [Bacteroidia bacterium]